jgi:hypothetical protein
MGARLARVLRGGRAHRTWIGTSALRASSRMTKPVTEFVAYLSAQRRRHWAGCGPLRPAPDRTDSWRERQVAEGLRNRYNSPLTTAAGRVYKKAPRGHEAGGGAEKARCEGGFAARWNGCALRAAGCRSS